MLSRLQRAKKVCIMYGMMNAMMWMFGLPLFTMFLGSPIASVLLAQRKNRNEVSWFFLSLFWGFMTPVILACSKAIDTDKGENDTLAKVLWAIIVSPLALLAIIFIIHRIMF